MSGSDSEPEVDQLEAFRNANIKPGMFVSGWDDSQDEVIEEKNPHGKQTTKTSLNFQTFVNFRLIMNLLLF